MKFDETGNILTFSHCDKCFIYFLLQGDEVVYVGQTTTGLSRPFAHQDKEFDYIKALPFPHEKLDEAEDYYISKYKPIYNKMRNYNIIFTLKRVKTIIKNKYNPKFNLWALKKILAELKIVPFRDEYTGCECITIQQYCEIEKYIQGRL